MLWFRLRFNDAMRFKFARDERKIVFIFFIKRINEIVQNSPPFPSIKFHQLNFIPVAVHSIIVKNSPTNYTRGAKTRNSLLRFEKIILIAGQSQERGD